MKGTAAFMKDLHDKTIKELVLMRRDVQKELYGYKMKNAIKGLKETHKISEAKTKIARINTVLTLKTKEQHGSDRK